MSSKTRRNERRTENLVRDALRDTGYFEEEGVSVDEQLTKNLAIDRLLRTASKSGSGAGFPEFIIRSNLDPEFVIIVECKADVRHHESQGGNRPKDFAVDGAIHYAHSLCRDFNVLAIAVSGETASEMRLSHFIVRKGQFGQADSLRSRYGREIDTILPFQEYFELFIYDPLIHQRKERDVIDFSKRLHNFVRDYAHLSEAEKPLVVSGILLALKDNVFFQTYGQYPDDRLPDFAKTTIDKVIDTQDIPNSKKLGIKQQYGFINTHTKLTDIDPNFDQSPLRTIIDDLKEHVFPFVSIYKDYDIVGKFYNEFLRYSGGDGKLGIVLTPKHITELFVDLAEIGRLDTVLDPCCGTGSFLIAAMHKMVVDCAGDPDRIRRVKAKGLVGIESQPKMFALAASNMILRGDGSCRLYEGSCFNEAHERDIKSATEIAEDGAAISSRPTAGLINPPYSLKGEGLSELQFVKTMLDYLQPGGKGVAIVPLPVAIEGSDLKRQLLEAHTLEAVISMPDDLFGKAATVVSCTMIFTAGRPHPSNKQVWFTRFKDDGFVTLKHIGRVDHFRRWPEKRAALLEAFRTRYIERGVSVRRSVTAADEWCAEAYIETDYGALHEADFEETIGSYLEYLHPEEEPETAPVSSHDWQEFSYERLFEIARGSRVLNRDLEPGDTPLIRCIKDNNGVVDRVNLPPNFPANVLTVNYNGSVGETFYQSEPFFATDDVLVLTPRAEMFDRFNQQIGLFVATIIKLERFRFHYSRKWNQERMRSSLIRLPATNDKVDVDALEERMRSFRFSEQLSN